MTPPLVRIKLYDVPDAEACVRGIRQEVRGLASRYSALTAILVGLAADSGQYEAHIDLHFPQHQIIVTAAAPTTERALHEVMAKVASELSQLEARDRSLASPPQAKAA